MARKKAYLNNTDLLEQLRISREQDKMTDELGKMILTLAQRYSTKPNFCGYTYRDDMVSHAVLGVVQSWRSFNPEKSNNPFAFFTQCIKNSFIQTLNKERKHRDIRDAILVDNGMDPSWTYEDER